MIDRPVGTILAVRISRANPGEVSMPEVVVTGLGLMLPGCDNRTSFWRQLSTGESQLELEPNPADETGVCPMGLIHDFDPRRHLPGVPERFHSKYPRETRLYLASVLLACRDADFDVVSVPADRIGLFDGSSRGNFAHWYDLVRAEANRPPSELYTSRNLVFHTPGQTLGLTAALLGIQGPTYTFAASCSSGAVAVGHAYRELRAGEIDVALASAQESVLIPPIYHMYGDAGLLSDERHDPRRAVRPYVGHSANAFAEGAVTLVLESRAHAERRGATPLATLAGYRYGNTGAHPTDVDPDGSRPAHVIKTLLDDAGLSPDRIGFVVGHGNGVPASDLSEIQCMRKVFGARSRSVPLISTKPIYGHTIGAASAVSVAAAVEMVHRGRGIRTANVDDSQAPADISFGHNGELPHGQRAGIALSFGLGGHNAAILVTATTGEQR